MTWFKIERLNYPSPNNRLNDLKLDLTHNFEKEFGSSKECVIDAVEQIVKKYPGPYSLLVSGGVDSQAMIYAWHLSNIPFNIIHYSYNGMNQHDTEYLINYCTKHNFNYEIRNFDALKFISSSELFEYGHLYDCSSPHMITYMKLCEHHDETVIMSGNFYYHNHIGVNYTILGLDRFREKSKPNFIPYFFCSNPNISFLGNYVDQSLFFKMEYYDYKCHVYNTFGSEVIPQPDSYTGFEKIKEHFDSEPVTLQDRYKYINYPSRRPFDVFFRYRLLSSIGKYSDVTRIVKEEKI